MTRPQRSCLDCGTLTRNPAGRCRPCQQNHDRTRNRDPKRVALYGGAHYATSRRARRAQPWCSLCDATTDLTFDHEHGQVECRSCNSAHHRTAT